MSRSAKGTNRERGRPSRQENISAPRLMMAELRPPCAPLTPSSRGAGAAACAQGTFLFFIPKCRKTLQKSVTSTYSCRNGRRGGAAHEAVSPVFHIWGFLFLLSHTRSSSRGGSRHGRLQSRYAFLHIYEHVFRLLLNVHVECHARSRPGLLPPGLRTCTWWEQLRLMMFAAPPPDRNDDLVIQPTSCRCYQTG